jgi:hypothetical protein
MHPAQLAGASDAGDDFCLTWQLPSAAQVAFSFPTFVQNQKKLTATYGFIKATSQEERNASPITTSDRHAMLGDAITQNKFTN